LVDAAVFIVHVSAPLDSVCWFDCGGVGVLGFCAETHRKRIMSQTSVIAATILLAFVIFITMRGELPKYISVML
jgi:hypothetical protein